jgi:mono/diheme cytochrome c family protein
MSDEDWVTEEGEYPEPFAIVSRDFVGGVFKGGGGDEDIYTRIYSGIPGSLMPPFKDVLSEREMWLLVDHVKRLAGRVR